MIIGKLIRHSANMGCCSWLQASLSQDRKIHVKDRGSAVRDDTEARAGAEVSPRRRPVGRRHPTCALTLGTWGKTQPSA